MFEILDSRQQPFRYHLCDLQITSSTALLLLVFNQIRNSLNILKSPNGVMNQIGNTAFTIDGSNNNKHLNYEIQREQKRLLLVYKENNLVLLLVFVEQSRVPHFYFLNRPEKGYLCCSQKNQLVLNNFLISTSQWVCKDTAVHILEKIGITDIQEMICIFGNSSDVALGNCLVRLPGKKLSLARFLELLCHLLFTHFKQIM